MISLERIVGDAQAVNDIKSISSCSNCHKESFENHYYQQSCHQGVYCQNCISFCANCANVMGLVIPSLSTLIKKVKFRCKNYMHGCNALSNYEDLFQHESNCSYRKEVIGLLVLNVSKDY